jgi:hypothetical protein
MTEQEAKNLMQKFLSAEERCNNAYNQAKGKQKGDKAWELYDHRLDEQHIIYKRIISAMTGATQ